MRVTMYWYPGCSTCKKAAKWLEANGVEHERVHLVEATPDVDRLADLWRRSGVPIKRLFNTSGRSYRAGGFSQRLPAMSDEDALEALAADGMLIKRPILDAGERVLIGFAEPDWRAEMS